MATKPKLNVLFAFFPYSGNGGISCEHPSIRRWYGETLLKCSKDERIDKAATRDFSDTPITMTRNAAVRHAQKLGVDVICMCDSDTFPDYALGQDSLAKPFWDSSFDFLYERFVRDKLTVIGAPYCGPSPLENVYVFRYANWETDHPNPDHRIEQFAREEAAGKMGIEDVAALPTGLILFDMRVWELLEPPWFYYEYTDIYESEKASTEDVTCTRDLGLMAMLKKRDKILFVNWDAWAGHMKPKRVEKPKVITLDQISEKYRRAVLEHGRLSTERSVLVGVGADLEAVMKNFVPFDEENGHAVEKRVEQEDSQHQYPEAAP